MLDRVKINYARAQNLYIFCFELEKTRKTRTPEQESRAQKCGVAKQISQETEITATLSVPTIEKQRVRRCILATVEHPGRATGPAGRPQPRASAAHAADHQSVGGTERDNLWRSQPRVY